MSYRCDLLHWDSLAFVGFQFGGATFRHLPHRKLKEKMELITIKFRTQKTAGKIKLRFRLREGRDVELYHKSDIEVDVSLVDKLTPEGTKRKGVTTVHPKVLKDISDEKDIMAKAYAKMKKDGRDMTSEVFEEVIDGIKHPVVEKRQKDPGIIDRFRSYTHDALRDGIIGKKRHDHILVVCGKLSRFLAIRGLNHITASEFTEANLMEFRNFMFDEYLYVPKYHKLYKEVPKNTQPKSRLSINTVASQMKMLQAFFNELENTDEIGKSPFRRLGRERKKTVMKTMYDEPIFLRKDELLKILKKKVPASLQDTKDAFLVQCALGCRISDFLQMNMDNVAVGSGGIPYVHYIPQKTVGIQTDNKEIETPLVRYAFDIIMLRNFEFPILQNLYGTNGFNAQIKYLLTVCKINRTVAQFNEQTQQNDYIPLCSLGSSKLARKTHVDMMNKVQIDMYAAGLHRQGSQAVKRYTSMELKDHFALMNLAFGQEPYRVNKKLKVIA